MADLGGGPELPDGQRIEARVTDFVVRLTFLGLFCFWAMQLVRPFLPVMIWSVLLTVALYPAYGALAGWLGGRKAVAAALITAIAMVTVLGPISVLATSLVESVTWLAGALKSGSLKIPPPPASVEAWRELWPEILPLPHPSGRNNGWLARRPWVEAEMIPALQEQVRALKA